MSDSFKPTKIGLLGFTPEVTQGTPNWDITADGGGVPTTTQFKIDTTSGTTHNDNLAGMGANLLDRLLIYWRSDTTTAALQGKVYTISAAVLAAGVVTVDTVETMAAAPAATDRCVIFAPLQASDVSTSVGYENLPRNEFERQTLDKPSSNKGLKVASGSFKWELPGLEQENGNGDTPRWDRFAQFLRAVGDRAAYAGTTIGAASASTTDINVASSASMSVGDWLLIDGEVCRITSVVSGTNILVSPALKAVPASGLEVFIGEITTPDDTGHTSHTILFARDTQLFEINGAVFSVGASGTFGGNMEASAEFDGEDWDITDSYTIDGQQSTKKAIPMAAGRGYFGSTELCINSFEFALGHGRQQLRDTCASQRQFITTREATLKLGFRNKDAVPKETWEANGTTDWLFVQVGNQAGGCVVFAGYGQIQDPAEMSDVEGMQYWDAQFAFIDDQTDADDPYKPLIIRF